MKHEYVVASRVYEIVRENYRYVGVIAAMFFVSIMVLFLSLRLDIRYARLNTEVQLLHERSFRLKE